MFQVIGIVFVWSLIVIGAYGVYSMTEGQKKRKNYF